MDIKNYEEITLGSDTFAQIRENFDLLLQRLFQKMQQNNSDEGSITLKVDINIITDYVPDENGKSQRIDKPVIKHKVSTTVPVKDSFDGKKDTGMELVYDEELARYVLKYVSVGGQRSIFDDDFADIVNGTATVIDDEEHALPMNVPQLPDMGGNEDDNGCSCVDDCSDEEIQDVEDKNVACGDTEACECDEEEYGYEE